MTFDFSALNTLGDALLSKRWIFAKTMPKNPHWYTLRREWNNDSLFDKVVIMMRKTGYTEYYYGKPYTMVNINGMKYWTMGDPMSETILINRKYIDKPSIYDAIADRYDGLHRDSESIKENCEIIDLLRYESGQSVLDIGCGTGLLLDYISPESYTGIDPSNKMLDVFRHNHPGANIIATSFEEYAGPRVDLVVSLFGAASYISPGAISRIMEMSKPAGRWFVMFYKNDYRPVTYDRAGITFIHYKDNHLLLPGTLSEHNNFFIVQGKHEDLP
jgi:hypothetical protein